MRSPERYFVFVMSVVQTMEISQVLSELLGGNLRTFLRLGYSLPVCHFRSFEIVEVDWGLDSRGK